jgi:hypothetical protein
MRTRRISWLALPSVGFCLAGCAGGAQSPPVIRVGDASVDKATVAHWAHAISLGNVVGASLGSLRGTPQTKALEFLIAAHWLIGEADAQRLTISDEVVERQLKGRAEAVPNGKTEFEEELSSTGQTTADAKLEIKAQLAATMLRESLSRRIPVVSSAEVERYYKHNLARFRVPEKRLVDLIEGIKTRAAAVALGKHLGPGARFAKHALHESVARQSPYEAAHRDNAELVRGIFAGKPGRLGEPARFNGAWVALVVRGSVPGTTKPLAEVAQEVIKRLTSQRRRQAVMGFIDGYRRKWTARTDCRPGFVVQKCSQYRGPIAPEGNPLLGY